MSHKISFPDVADDDMHKEHRAWLKLDPDREITPEFKAKLQQCIRTKMEEALNLIYNKQAAPATFSLLIGSHKFADVDFDFQGYKEVEEMKALLEEIKPKGYELHFRTPKKGHINYVLAAFVLEI